jgi:hypothetical protein
LLTALHSVLKSEQNAEEKSRLEVCGRTDVTYTQFCARMNYEHEIQGDGSKRWQQKQHADVFVECVVREIMHRDSWNAKGF